MIAITSDIDWAPEEVISDFLGLFEERNVKCTLFCTHESAVIKNCNRELFEIAIHPNFNKVLEGQIQRNAKDIVEELITLYPEAVGVRSHSMTQSTSLLNLFKEYGMKYDSNHFLPYSKHLKLEKLWNGLVRVPYNWEDDIHYLYKNRFEEFGLDLRNETLNVFDFHPIHVFLNTDTEQTYLKAKVDYQVPAKLKERRDLNRYGARKALIALLDHIVSNRVETYTVKELVEDSGLLN